MPAPSPHIPLAATTRGGIVESVHHGSVAIVDRDGAIVFAAGDPARVTFTRSSLKPLQALPFVAAGGIDRFRLTPAETALLCASHSGEARHIDAAASILGKAANAPQQLLCGTHAPMHYEVRGEVPPPPPYSPLAHNCSGKHSGMLAHCTACGYDHASYLDLAHPLQVEIRGAVAHMSGVAESDLIAGIDGCSAPNYAMPLAGLALAFARLAAPDADSRYGDAPQRLAQAMTSHPEMVSGEGRSDLALMLAGRGDWVCKVGAEGVQAIGVKSRGVGIAVKIADGNRRALLPVVVSVLEQAGLLDSHARAALAPLATPTLRNNRGLPTGDVRPLVVLDKGNHHLTSVAAGARE